MKRGWVEMCHARRVIALLAAFGALHFPQFSYAYDFSLSQFEFDSWPPYCKARYVEVMGASTGIRFDASADYHRRAKESVGHVTYAGVHHYCAGTIWLDRARAEGNPQKRRFALDQAYGEVNYSLVRSPPGAPLNGRMAIAMARIERERGRSEESIRYLEWALKENPTDPMTYLAVAIAYRERKDLEAARKWLEEGLEVTGGASVDLHYNLGLICLELNDSGCAMEHAREAYRLDYPLPGLKRKLVERGLWEN